MSKQMFSAFVSPPAKIGRGKLSLALTILAHAVVLAVIVIAPLMATDILPNPWERPARYVSDVMLPAPPPEPVAPRLPKRPPLVNDVPGPTTPTEMPKVITKEDPRVPDNIPEGPVKPGVPGGVPDEPHEWYIRLPEPPPLPPPPKEPVRVGGNIRQPNKVRDVKPVYPAIAQSARVGGVVIIEAVIGADGRVKDMKVLRSIPLLDQAALEAVRQWEFTPTLLNGMPIPVIMTVTVNFTLQ